MWDTRPRMMAAGLGFTNIIGVPGLTTTDLAGSEARVRKIGGTWNAISCAAGATPALSAYTSASNAAAGRDLVRRADDARGRATRRVQLAGAPEHARRRRLPRHADERDTFKFSTDPELEAKVRDVVGLYLAPPRNAIMLCVDEKSHKHDDINRWLAKHARITLRFTPTSGSWMNLVEVFFGIITRQAIHRGSFDNVAQLVATIRAFIDGYDDRCKPFTWTKTADDILPRATRQPTSDARR